MVFRLLRICSEQICQPCFACLLLAEISETIRFGMLDQRGYLVTKKCLQVWKRLEAESTYLLFWMCFFGGILPWESPLNPPFCAILYGKSSLKPLITIKPTIRGICFNFSTFTANQKKTCLTCHGWFDPGKCRVGLDPKKLKLWLQMIFRN